MAPYFGKNRKLYIYDSMVHDSFMALKSLNLHINGDITPKIYEMHDIPTFEKNICTPWRIADVSIHGSIFCKSL